MTDPRIQSLVDNPQESLDIEVKNWLNGLREKADKAKLAKEIIALANSGGGCIVIGFEDKKDNSFPEIEPKKGELEAFTQDAIADIAQSYVSPPCQCRVEMISREDSKNQHPVIIVPGNHRTPLFAKRGGPQNESPAAGKVYIRRQGGRSEEPQNQDDWEKLIDRLVKARQSDMLNSIREILNPSSETLVKDDDLDSWRDENIQLWRQKVDKFPEDDPRRLKNGFWTVTFSINPFQAESLDKLNTVLYREMPWITGHPPFSHSGYIAPGSPKAQGDCIIAYLGESAETKNWDCGFWRICKDGKAFSLRPMLEDSPSYNNPSGNPFFEWTYPICCATEILKYIEILSGHFSNENENASFHLIINYYHTRNRELQQYGYKYNLVDGSICYSDSLNSSIKEPVTKIETNIEELILRLLIPIYEQFNFTKLPADLVRDVVKRSLNY